MTKKLLFSLTLTLFFLNVNSHNTQVWTKHNNSGKITNTILPSGAPCFEVENIDRLQSSQIKNTCGIPKILSLK